MKIKILLICLMIFLAFVVTEKQVLFTNASLIYANIMRDMSRFSGDQLWVTRYNEAIWLSGSGRYDDAKKLLIPLLNDTSLPKSGEIAELYGDIIYATSGSTDDVIHMYERSLSLAPSDRVTSKIVWIREQARSEKTATGTTEKTRETNTGSRDLDAKKIELQKISEERGKYLDMNSNSQDSASILHELVESVRS